MANTYLKPSVIGRTMIQLLLRELVVTKTVWTNAIRSEEFVQAVGDTVNMRVPAKRAARTRTLRAGTPLVMDDSNEFAVPVKLTTDVYNGAPITDEELTLDITDFGAQVLVPQVRAVAEGIEDLVVAEITGADYDPGDVIDIDEQDPFGAMVEALTALNTRNVPTNGRYLLVGSSVQAAMLNSDRWSKYNSRGPAAEQTVDTAILSSVLGFTVVPSNAVPANEAYAYHQTAFVLAARTPRVPMGATMGQDVPLSRAEGVQVGASQGGLTARWVMDYDSVNARDRSFTSTYVGTATVEDPDDVTDPQSTTSFLRGVKLELPGS